MTPCQFHVFLAVQVGVSLLPGVVWIVGNALVTKRAFGRLEKKLDALARCTWAGELARRTLLRHPVNLPEHRIFDAVCFFGIVPLLDGMRRLGALRLAAGNGDAKLHVLNGVVSDQFSKALNNLVREPVQLPLPDGVFHVDDNSGAHQPYIRGVRRDCFADCIGPSGADEFAGGQNLP
jgi:hypothetical protein